MTRHQITAFFFLFCVFLAGTDLFAAHAYRVETSNLPKEFRAPKQRHYLLFEAKDKAHPLRKHSDIVLYLHMDLAPLQKLSKQKVYKRMSDQIEKQVLPDALETNGSNYVFASLGHKPQRVPNLLYDRIRKKGLHQPIYATLSLAPDSFAPVQQAMETKGFFKSATVFLSDQFSTTSKQSKVFLDMLYRDGHQLRGKTQINLVFIGTDLRAKKHHLNTLLSHLKKLGLNYTTNIFKNGKNVIALQNPNPFMQKAISWSSLIAATQMKNKKLSSAIQTQQQPNPPATAMVEEAVKNLEAPKKGGMGTHNMNTQGLGDAILEFEN